MFLASRIDEIVRAYACFGKTGVLVLASNEFELTISVIRLVAQSRSI
jgi:hypothetical protein